MSGGGRRFWRGQARPVALMVRLSVRRMFLSPLYLISIVVLPFMAVLMIGVVLGPTSRALSVGVVGGTQGEVGPRVLHALTANKSLKVRAYRDQGALQAAIQRGDVLAGLVLPADADQGEAGSVLMDPSRPAGPAARLAMVDAADAVGAVVGAARFGAAYSSATPAQSLAEADRLSGLQRRVAVRAGYPAGTVPRGEYDYGVVGTLVLFMFITAVSGGALLVDARQRGLTSRLLATDIRPSTLLVGEVLSRYVTVLFQAGVVVLFGRLLFHVHWGQPAAVAAVVAVYALVGAAAGIAVGALASTFEQAILFGTVGALALGMLGGCLWPLELAPPGLRALARLTPQHWAVDALLGLVGRSSGAAALAPGLAVLGAFAVVIMAASSARLRRMAVL